MQKHHKSIFMTSLIWIVTSLSLIANPAYERLNRLFPFEERMYEICEGHGEYHWDKERKDQFLKEVEANYPVMLALIQKTENERFLERLTNSVISSNLSSEEKNEFFRQAHTKAKQLQENGEVWIFFMATLIEKTSILSTSEIETYADCTNEFLREVAKKELSKRSSENESLQAAKKLEGANLPNPPNQNDFAKRNEWKKSPLGYLYWIVCLVIFVGFLLIIWKKRRS